MAYRHYYHGNQYTNNQLDYSGPYPYREVQAARNYFTNQFLNSNSKSIRTLRRKVSNISYSFYHKEQIETVKPGSFDVIQETAVEKEESPRGVNSVAIDIHAVDNDGEPAVKVRKLTSATVSETTTLNSGIDFIPLNSDSNGNDVINLVNDGDHINSNVNGLSSNAKKEETGYMKGSINTGDIVISSDEEEGEFSSEKETGQCLMCDLCDFVVGGCNMEDEEQMRNHFTTTNHNAASIIEVDIINGDEVVPKYVIEKLYLSDGSKKSPIVPVCPQCKMIHGSIWNCAMHYQKDHDKNECYTYGLGEAVWEIHDEVSKLHVCKTCNRSFDSASKLHKHWKGQKHFPFSDPSPNQVLYFECSVCGIKGQSFLTIRGHMLGHTDHFNKSNGIPSLRITCYEQTSSSGLKLLPDKPKSAEDQIISNKMVYRKSVNTFLSNKRQRKGMKKFVLPSKAKTEEYTKGVMRKSKDGDRYIKVIKSLKNYNRYHYRAGQTSQVSN